MVRLSPENNLKPREASTLIFKFRSCGVISDLKNRYLISRKCHIFKICSCNARSDLKNKSARFSAKAPRKLLGVGPAKTCKLGLSGSVKKFLRFCPV